MNAHPERTKTTSRILDMIAPTANNGTARLRDKPPAVHTADHRGAEERTANKSRKSESKNAESTSGGHELVAQARDMPHMKSIRHEWTESNGDLSRTAYRNRPANTCSTAELTASGGAGLTPLFRPLQHLAQRSIIGFDGDGLA